MSNNTKDPEPRKAEEGKWSYFNLPGSFSIIDENGKYVCAVTKEEYAKTICEAVNARLSLELGRKEGE